MHFIFSDIRFTTTRPWKPRNVTDIPGVFLKEYSGRTEKQDLHYNKTIINQSNSFFISNCAICFMSLMSKNVYMLQPFIIQNNNVHYLHQPRCFIILSENAALTKRLNYLFLLFSPTNCTKQMLKTASILFCVEESMQHLLLDTDAIADLCSYFVFATNPL